MQPQDLAKSQNARISGQMQTERVTSRRCMLTLELAA